MKLYEIDNAIMECVDDETGEIIDFDKLENLMIERDKKLEGVAIAIKNLNAEANEIRQEEKNLVIRRLVIERKIDGYKEWLKTQLRGKKFQLRGKKFETARAVCSFRKSTSVSVDDSKFTAWALSHDRDDLLHFREPTPNRVAIKSALKSNEQIPGCKIVESISMTVK